jgi:hypothetical protein
VLQKRRTSSNVAQVVAHRTPAVASRGFADAAPHRAVGRRRRIRPPRPCLASLGAGGGRLGTEAGRGRSKEQKEAVVGSRRQVKPAESRCDGGRRRRRRPHRPAPDPATAGPASSGGGNRRGKETAGAGSSYLLRRRWPARPSPHLRRRGSRPPQRPEANAASLRRRGSMPSLRLSRRGHRSPPPPGPAAAGKEVRGGEEAVEMQKATVFPENEQRERCERKMKMCLEHPLDTLHRDFVLQNEDAHPFCSLRWSRS